MRPPLAAILADMPLRPVPFTPGIRLHLAHPRSGLRRLGDSDEPPYWAYVWGGGAALARYILGHPQTVAGRRVLDLGAGGGIVGIAAALAGARQVLASDTDPNALAVLGVNAAANGIAIEIQPGDLTAGPPPDVDLVAVGDLFYAADLGRRSCRARHRLPRPLPRGRDRGPGRRSLPRLSAQQPPPCARGLPHAGLRRWPVSFHGRGGVRLHAVAGTIDACRPQRPPRNVAGKRETSS
jgi:predicted nicotinamide N-methyase